MAELILTDSDLKLLAEVGKTIREKGIIEGHAMLAQSEPLKRTMEKLKTGFQDPAEFRRYGNACSLCAACAGCGTWFPPALVVGVDGVLTILDVHAGPTIFGRSPEMRREIFDADPPTPR